MDRRRGNFTPRGRGRGGPRGSPSYGGSDDRRSHNSAGAEPSSSGERTWQRKETFSAGKQMSWERKSAPKQAQPATSDREFSSPVQSQEPDLSNNLHANSSASRETSWQRNERPSVQRHNTSWQGRWKQAQPVAYKATLPQPIVPEKGSSVDGPLNLDRSLMDNLECPIEKSCKDPESVGGSENLNKGDSSQHSECAADSEWERKSAPKQAQPATSDREFSSPVQSQEPDLSNNLHANSSASRETSWQRNERPSVQRHNTSWQGHTGWKQAQAVAYKATLPQPIVPEKGSSVDGPLNLDRSLIENLECPIEKCCKDPESVGGSENLNKDDSSLHSECAADAEPFDICPPPNAGVFKLNSSLIVMNKEMRKQKKQSLEPKCILLRSGMVLLKNYISLQEQAEIVNECRKLGKGKGGFYQPGYRDGAKLNLKMMCLGKNWDPQTSSYGDIRPIDGVKPPPIPSNFFELVKRSIKESHTQISNERGSTGKVEAILPWMSPDICLVNFYTTSGRLGLHQDRDESGSSLDKGLPVVSISIGDTAVFLYGDQSDVHKAEKVNLDSGDVLIFGGKSRHVYHGVSSITPNSAPKPLLDKTNLRAGRLNLTFREY